MATQFEIDCALMAGRAYQTNRDPNGINWFPAPSGWNEFFHVPNNPDFPSFTGASGFEASSFQNTADPNSIVISFAGTNGFFTVDQFANLGLATGAGSDQLLQAVDYYLQVRKDNPGANITFTGHSLGGGIAALMGVFFGRQAVTFDQAPFANTAEQGLFGTASYALNLQTYLIGKPITDPAMSAIRDTLVTDLGTFLQHQQTNGGIPNSDLVSTYRVTGEFTSSFPVGTLFDPIGAPASFIQHGPTNISAVTELHSQTLLTAMLQSGDTPTSTASDHTLGQVTFKLTDLLQMIFDKNLFAHDADTTEKNFLERLVKHEATVINPATGETDKMVTRFTSDLWKLAQDGGLTMSENFSYSNWNNVSKTLIAFAMQKYYDEQAASIGAGATLFQNLSNGIRFDIADVSQNIAAAISGNAPIDLAAKQDGKYILKGYEYFLNYLDNTSLLSPAERTLIKSMLPQLRDWYVQAGTGGMVATDTLNRGAFMLGGTGADTLTGGTATDLLVGNAGADTLQGGGGNDMLLGGSGNDTYVYTNGGGLDTILDSDGQGSIVVDGATLAGGGQYGDNRVHKDANGHLYVQAGGNLIIDGGILIKDYNPNFGNGMGLALGDAVQQNTQPNITGDLAPIDTDPSATGVQTQTDALGNVIVDPATSQPGRGDWLYGSAGADVIEGKGGSDILDGKNGDDRLYAGTQISAATAIAQGNAQAGNGATGDWLNGGAGGICMRQRTRAAIINSSKAANDETAHVWRVAA